MKTSLIFVFVLFSNLVLADSAVNSLTVFEGEVRRYEHNAEARARSQFYFDLSTGQGYFDIKVTETRDSVSDFPFPGRACDNFGCYDNSRRFPEFTRTIFRMKEPIEGLQIVDKQIIYNRADKEINCGYLSKTRVLKRVLIKLNGNCKLRTSYSFNNLKVMFVTK